MVEVPKSVSRHRILLITGVVAGIASLVLAGIWLLQREPNGPGQDETPHQKQFVFENAVGEKAPDFSLIDASGKAMTLSSLLGKNVILFFSEGLMCYPCVVQITALSVDKRLNNNETVSYSIVTESRESWYQIWKDNETLSAMKVLFDSEAKVSRSYDTLELPSSMHKSVHPGHTYFIVDKKGAVRFAFDDYYMGIRNDELVREIERIEP